MLRITIPGIEMFDDVKEEFIKLRAQNLQLEHSLVSITKWESTWHKPFFSNERKTQVETLDYIRCMTITQNVSEDTYRLLTPDNIDEINKYIEEPMTATIISDNKNKRGSREIITSEIIYYWMVALNIPFECQKWHLNRLLTLINVCNIKNQPDEKMGRRELLNRNRSLNNARKKQMRTKG